MKSIRNITLATVLATGLAMCTLETNAQLTSAGGSSVKGKVTAVDKSAQTVIIDGRTFQVLPTTRITSNDQQVSIDEVKTGQQISGQYKQSAENKLELTTVELSSSVGGTSDNSSSESGNNFNGKVSKVDSASQTVTIGNQTYQFLPTSRITKNDQQVSFNDIKAGTQVSGQFKKSSENNLEVLSADITPAVGGTKDSTGGATTTESGGNKFSGKVSNVDATKQRVTIGGRTYQILPTTTVTLANGKQTSVNNLKPNQQVSGTYKQADSGNYEILSLHVVGNSSRPE
jgi:ribosome maturation factor RimP